MNIRHMELFTRMAPPGHRRIFQRPQDAQPPPTGAFPGVWGMPTNERFSGFSLWGKSAETANMYMFALLASRERPYFQGLFVYSSTEAVKVSGV